MISSSTTSSADRTNPLRTLRTEESRASSPDSRASTTPLPQRAFNGELAAETSGKRVRPDATVRGIGPSSEAADRTSPTIEVRSSELECLSEVHSETGELQIPWMRNDFKFVLAVGGGAFLLVLSMLMVMSRATVSETPSETNSKATVSTGALGDPGAALNAKAPAAEQAPPQESEPFAPAQVKPLLDEEAAGVAAAESAERKAVKPALRSTKTARVAKPKAKLTARTSLKSKKVTKKTRARL